MMYYFVHENIFVVDIISANRLSKIETFAYKFNI